MPLFPLLELCDFVASNVSLFLFLNVSDFVLAFIELLIKARVCAHTHKLF